MQTLPKSTKFDALCVQVPEENLPDNTLLKAILERVVLSTSHDNWLLPAAVSGRVCVCVRSVTCDSIVPTGGSAISTFDV